MKNLILLALTLTAPAAWADTTCTEASGQIQYQYVGYNQGIPPRNGDVIGTISIRAKGKTVSESIAYKGLNPQLGPISPELTEITELNQKSGPAGSTKDFSAKLTLTKSVEFMGEVNGIELPYSGYVICQENFKPVP